MLTRRRSVVSTLIVMMAAGSLGAVLLFAGCGQKGPLTLPTASAAKPAAVPASSPSPAR